MKQVLKSPAIYQLYQELGGFFGARVEAIRDYLSLRPGMRIIDIGCGPGHIVKYLPRGIDYIGLDIDEPSIATRKAISARAAGSWRASSMMPPRASLARRTW